MSAQGYEIRATLRDAFGKAASRRVRRQAAGIPGVVYGAGKDVEHIMLEPNQIAKAIEEVGFHSHILDLVVEGKKQKVVLKAFQRRPGHHQIMHLDFMRISMKEKMTMIVPLQFVGGTEAPGVREGGVVSHSMTEIEVRCMPSDLPEQIEVALSELGMDQVVHVSDLKLPEGVELTIEIDEEHNPPVAAIHMPRVEAEEPEGVEGEGDEEGADGAEESAEAEDKGDAAEADSSESSEDS